jgi:hypothetical protein
MEHLSGAPDKNTDPFAKANDGGKGRKTVSRRDINMEAASSKSSKPRNDPKNLVKPSKESVRGEMAAAL